MIDYHCHLDLYRNPMDVFSEARHRNTEVLAVTTSPRAYLKAKQHFVGAPSVHIALGFHPELVSSRVQEQALFFDTVRECKFIGEVGLDASGKNKDSLDIQKRFFVEALYTAESNGGRIISIHSRASTKETLDCIEQFVALSTPVLHWFTGSIKEAERAWKLGCWFSINPRMLSTKSGNAIIKSIPLSRVLPETDAPFVEKNGVPYMPWDTTVVNQLATMYGISVKDMEKTMLYNLQSLHRKHLI